jgi:DNA adenine methylase
MPTPKPAATGESVRPILKWAGGKRQLLPALRRYYPPQFDRYFEPFLGSGAVFLDCHNHGLLDGRAVHLSDINADVIGCYRMVRDDVEGVIGELVGLDEGHRRDGRRHFYEVRDGRFNVIRRDVHASRDPATAYTPAVRICDGPNLRRWSAALGRPDLTLEVGSFEESLGTAGRGDFVYLDPPYAPVSATAHFTSYTAGRFGADSQAALQRAVIGLARRGAAVLLSNSVAPDIRRLYKDDVDARSAGLAATTVAARRAINSQASRRGAVREYVITNIRVN